jgi:putative transposase
VKHIIDDEVALSRPLEGPLAAQIPAFARYAREEGYARQSRYRRVLLAAGFSRWLGQQAIRLRSVASEDSKRYLRARARRVQVHNGDAAALRQFLGFLRRHGVIPAEKVSARRLTPVEHEARAFEHYLRNDRALSRATCVNYVPFVRGFLTDRFGHGPVALSRLCAGDVVGFVRRQAPRLHLKRAKLLTSAMRSFLRYARYRGEVTLDLAAAVPVVANWSMSSIPRAIGADEVRQLLASIDRHTAIGRRDYAIVLLLARLGLRAGEVAFLEVPRSTARGWLEKAPKVVVSLDVTDLRASELQQEVLELRRRVKKLTALLRLALTLLQSSGFTLTHEGLPDGRAKTRILRAVDRAREFVPLGALLRFLRLSPSRFHAWRRLQHACALDDQSSCPRASPHRLTPSEVRAIKDMVTAPEYRHVPTGTLAVLAQRLGKVWASPSTWHHLVRKFGWRRPRLRVHPAKPRAGLRTTRADEMWHIDTSIIRLLDGTRAYLHAVIDNFSRRILAWRVTDTFAPVNSVAVLLEASRGATPSATTPVVLADAGVENVNAQVDDLLATGVLRRVLAFTELKFSNSMIEAWWRSLKHQWLFLHSLDSVTTVRRLVTFYVDEHNRMLPHSAFRGQTPDEMYFGTGDAVAGDLMSGAAAARRRRVAANRTASCERCPSVDAAA